MKKVITKKVCKEVSSEPKFKAFPAKSFDEVLQPIIDICIDELETILKSWAKKR